MQLYGNTMMIKEFTLAHPQRVFTLALGQILTVWGISTGLILNLSLTTPKRHMRDFKSSELCA